MNLIPRVRRAGVAAVLALPLLAPRSRAPAEIYEFALAPTALVPAALGTGALTLARSPFVVAVSADGHLVSDLALEVSTLPEPRRLGPYVTYVVWVASPNLDRVERLGTITASGTLRGRLEAWNKFLILVTAEADPEPDRRRGPVVLQGRSPSGLMAAFASHELSNNMPH